MMRRCFFALSFSVLWACSGDTVDVDPPADSKSTGDDPEDATANESTEASSFACDIDNIEGKFEVTYTKISGTCPELPAQEYELTPNILWKTEGCTTKDKETSADRCVSRGSADCVIDSTDEHVEGSITQTSDDAMDGTVDIEVTSTLGTCTGKYTVSYRRK